MPDDCRLLLIVRIDGERVAVPAALVESVVEIDRPTPVPRVAAHVVGLAPLRSRVLTVIDCRLSIGRPAIAFPPGQPRPAVVVCLDGHGYGLLVDEVEDVIDATEVHPGVPGFRADWARVSLGLTEIGDDTMLVVDPAALIAGPAHAAAA